jgi:hypothetical protein
MKPSVRNGTWYATLGPRQHVDFDLNLGVEGGKNKRNRNALQPQG